MDAMCYSARFIPAFARLLSGYGERAAGLVENLKHVDPESRVPIPIMHQWLNAQIEQTGDPDLGLKFIHVAPLGAAGALEYAMYTAPTVRRSIEAGARYSRWFSDALCVDIQMDSSRAVVRFESSVPTPRAMRDVSMSSWYAFHTRSVLGQGPPIQAWFAHPKPSKTIEYERTFPSATLRFNAPFYGFVMSREAFESPLASADAPLHAVLCEHVAMQLAHLSERNTIAGAVREIAMKELLRGVPCVGDVAKRLHMSTRTLGRRLEVEGTTFSALVDDTRRELALRYVGNDEIAFSEVALRLRFSHAEAFYRAFKRWTGQTPLVYRRARRPSNGRGAAI
jgi:AraC-like DNA-binding protein